MLKFIKVQKSEVDKCRCGNLFAHWKKFGHQDIRSCPVKGCSGTDVKGTFVKKEDSEDSATYIIPLCSEHAKSSEVLGVLDTIRFVNSNFAKTCGAEPGKLEEANIL